MTQICVKNGLVLAWYEDGVPDVAALHPDCETALVADGVCLVPDEETGEVADPRLAMLKADLQEAQVQAIDDEAARRILALLTEVQQRNAAARSAALVHKALQAVPDPSGYADALAWAADAFAALTGKTSWAAEEQAEDTDASALWAQIGGLRRRSNELTTRVMGQATEELRDFKAGDGAHWA